MTQKNNLHPNDIVFGRRYKEDATGMEFAIADVTSTGVLLLEYSPGEHAIGIDVDESTGRFGFAQGKGKKAGSRDELLHVTFKELMDNYTNQGVLEPHQFLLYVVGDMFARRASVESLMMDEVLRRYRDAHATISTDTINVDAIYTKLAAMPAEVRIALARVADGQMVPAIKFVRTMLSRTELGATRKALELLGNTEDVREYNKRHPQREFAERNEALVDALTEHHADVVKALGLALTSVPAVVFLNQI